MAGGGTFINITSILSLLWTVACVQQLLCCLVLSPVFVVVGPREQIGLIFCKWKTGRQTSHHWSVHQSRWTCLFFSIHLIRKQALPPSYLLDVLLDKTHTQAATDANAHPTNDTQEEWSEAKCPAEALTSPWEGWQNALIRTEWGNRAWSEAEARNIKNRKPLLKFEFPAASTLFQFVVIIM